MARTKHKHVKRVHHRAAKKSAASNSDLKQATHRGRAPVKDARIAPPGFAGVPASVATLTPGQGPLMSSTPGSAGRGSNATGKKGRTSSKSATSVQAIQNAAAAASTALAYASPRGRASSSRKRRGKRASSN